MSKLYYFLVGIMLPVISLYAADDVKVKINDSAGANTFVIQNSGATNVVTITSLGEIQSGNTNNQVGAVALSDGSSNLITITAPSITADYTLTLPTNAGATNQPLETDGNGNLSWGPAPTVYNQSVSAQGGTTAFLTNTYLIGSGISIPGTNSLKAGTRYHCIFDVSKTAGASTLTSTNRVHFGTTGTTNDPVLLTFSYLPQTSVADIGTFEVWVTFRTIGSGVSAVIQGTSQCRHRLSATGLQNLPSVTLQVTSGGFDSTVANSIIGIGVTSGTGTVWTVQTVQAELSNLN